MRLLSSWRTYQQKAASPCLHLAVTINLECQIYMQGGYDTFSKQQPKTIQMYFESECDCEFLTASTSPSYPTK